MKRVTPLLVLLLATTACGSAVDPGNGSGSGPSESARNPDVQFTDTAEVRAPEPITRDGSPSVAGPNIGTTAAPDVAFAYRYSARLPAARVAEVQDQHQELCERLGIARCRITGMSYRAENAEDVEASLSFAVDPAVAGSFGREAARRVTAADGSITDSQITGEDVGTPLGANQRRRSDLEANLARIETRLRGMDAASAEKNGLEAQAQELRRQIAELREAANRQQTQLATTPILFRYGSGRFAPGPAEAPTLAETAQTSGESALAGLLLLLRLLLILAPWAAVGALGWWAVRRIRRHIPPARPNGDTGTA